VIPVPTPDADTLPYWEGLTVGELCIQRCRRCRRFQHFPAPVCGACCGMDLGFERVSGRGRVESFVVVEHAAAPFFADRTPYVIAWVELAEQAHLRVVADVIDCPPQDVRIGLAVSAVIDHLDLGNGSALALPRFRPTTEEAWV
jgi:uncharacterized OB-fold protein